MVQSPQNTTIVNPALRVLVERIVSFYNPDDIYLFGSRARGDFHEESDYDLAVLVPGTTPEEALGSTYKLKQGLAINADLKIYTRTEFDKQIHLKASMPSTILREGKLLFSRTGTTDRLSRCYSPANGESWQLREGEPPTSDPVRLDNAFDWMQRAASDLRGAEWFLTGNREADLGQSLFHSQQAVEKALKAYLVWCDQPTARHHDLNSLAADCLQSDQSLETDLRSIAWLTEWCIAGRYVLQSFPRPTIYLAQEGVASARRVYQAILERLPPEVTGRLEQS
jgi:HEPN domain-containing protein/predicted nucleotidyltransferase